VTGEKPREIAVRILLARQQRQFVEDLLEHALRGVVLKREDRGFIQELVYGVARWELTLDWLIARKTSGKSQKPFIQNVLRLGLYQMFWLDRVPSYAAVNECVELCKKRGFLAESKFINAILRRYGREVEETRRKLDDVRQTNLARGFSHPDWLCRRWEQRWGKATTVELLNWNNTPPPTYARVNEIKARPEELRESWRAEGVEFSETSFEWVAPMTIFRLEAHPALAELKSFQTGLFYIQDPSTVVAVQMLSPRKGEAILDLCAAPGGKTTCIAQLVRNGGRILAEDLDPDRLKRVKENAERLGAISITTDSAAFPRDTTFDRILVDVPCSNTGVIRRRVELRWRLRPEEIQRLALTQLSILRAAARRLRAGGTLVYSTCSLEREENHGVIREFLNEHLGFKLEAERELTPMANGVDGAYCARLLSA
jgi:16S rRNA (cytosine967-C5)-methyltransferase